MTSICRLYSVDPLGFATKTSSIFTFCSMQNCKGTDRGLRLFFGMATSVEKLGTVLRMFRE